MPLLIISNFPTIIDEKLMKLKLATKAKTISYKYSCGEL